MSAPGADVSNPGTAEEEAQRDHEQQEKEEEDQEEEEGLAGDCLPDGGLSLGDLDDGDRSAETAIGLTLP